MLILNILIFILILGLLVFVHELGHFLVAKRVGMKVNEFAFGFPPRLFSKKYKGTRYAINLIPLGGYVKIEGEDGDSVSRDAFNQKSISARIAVLVAGVSMNLLLAVIILAIGFKIGMVPLVSDYKNLGGEQQPFVIISGVVKDSAADNAGIMAGKKIVSINGEPVSSSTQTIELTKNLRNQNISLGTSDVNNKNFDIINFVLPDKDAPMGVYLVDSAVVKLGFLASVKTAIIETGLAIWAIIVFLGQFLAQLFSTGTLNDQVSGPIGIYQFTSQAINLGFTFVLQLIGILSINLAILNIAPFPALDGGRVLFVFLEKIFGRKVVHERIEGVIHAIGFILLIALFLAITYKDILRIG
ncbi:MAG: membrane-associated zinc metalloprotease [Candidatus Berkelbacteria bacterium Licking1014_85]|uniref:Membrane-associated zinc metalloprotease n=1 Tax=Candidatus Berkelbacteria bacterium Licking1014_85 TaxID=2017148 RepID=A0A554LH96_9BACT|nr:MAG: membrane-associated zinc metalloprotease [Candidatus Berkelbacteria bacterium Licking1014_85]